jgi:hypothetical protein
MTLRLINPDKIRVATMQNGRIHAGVPKDDNRSWEFSKDVTNDVLRSIGELADMNQKNGEKNVTLLITKDGEPTHVMMVKRIKK